MTRITILLPSYVDDIHRSQYSVPFGLALAELDERIAPGRPLTNHVAWIYYGNNYNCERNIKLDAGSQS